MGFGQISASTPKPRFLLNYTSCQSDGIYGELTPTCLHAIVADSSNGNWVQGAFVIGEGQDILGKCSIEEKSIAAFINVI